VAKRVAPSFTTYNPSAANAKWRDITGGSDVTFSLVAANENNAVVASSATLTSNDLMYIHWAADAEI